MPTICNALLLLLLEKAQEIPLIKQKLIKQSQRTTILTALLALVALAGQAKKTIVWENPSVAYSVIPYFQIQKVEMTKEKTAMYVRMALLPGYGFRISEDSYLQTNGKQ